MISREVAANGWRPDAADAAALGMPLVAAAVLAYAGGLLSGSQGPSWIILVASAPVVWLGARRSRERVALAALLTGGLASGVARATALTACAERIVAGAAAGVTVRLEAEATPGAFIATTHSCGARVRLAVARGRGEEGAEVRASGAGVRVRDDVLISDAVVRQLRRPGPLARWRASVGRGIDARFGADAPLVRALLIADMRALAPAVRERFAAAGLSHMLSVSGLHVGLIAVAMGLVAQIAGIGRGRADLLTVSLTALYVLVIGAPLPAVRAAVMLGAVSLAHAVQRPTSAWAVLAVSALLPLLGPDAVSDLGYQLSVVGMVALVASGVLAHRLALLSAGGWRGSLARGLAASLLATLLTAPLVAATFGRISLVAPLTNIVAVPLMAVLQPMLFLAALLLPVPGAAQFVADASHPVIAGIEWVAAAGAGLPGASVAVVADGVSLALAGAAALTLVAACVMRHGAGALAACGCCVAVLVWRPLIPVAGGMTELHMIDVGQGDAIALRTARGRWVLFDAGRDWRGGDAGRRDVVPYIAARGGSLTGFVLSHPHADHAGGAASVIRALGPGWYVDPGFAGGSPSYAASLAAARAARTRWRRVRAGDSVQVDEATIVFLAPDSAWAESLRDPNDASIVALVRVGRVTLLLTGDAEAAEEGWLLQRWGTRLDVDVLKVAHHGSSTSSTASFLAAVSPRVALVSVGAGNVYRHPSPDVLRALAAQGAITLRTDRHGSVVLRTDGARIEVEAGGERWVVR